MGQVARRFEVVEGGCLGVAQGAPKQPTKQPLNNLEKWVAASEVQALAGVSQQGVNKALRARRWRGVDLMVREDASNVGQGGKVLRVHVDSLPSDLREAWYLARGVRLHDEIDAATGEVRRVPDGPWRNDARHEERAALARWRLSVIRPAVDHPRGSAARKSALDAIVGQMTVAPDGRRKTLSRSTLYNWVAAYDAKGLSGLVPDERKDKGAARTVVTAAWDQFFAGRLDLSQHQEVGERLTHYIRSLWASGEAGWRAVCEKSTTRLIEVSRELRDLSFDSLPLGRLGSRANAGSQFGVCFVNRRLAEAQRDYNIIAVKRRDNARYQDTIAPTIRRDYSQLQPREIVVGDVHPMDIMVLRPDGTRAYPKAISWFDPSTNEIHMTVVLLVQGEGVRREHVAMSFEAMVADWGLPKLMYLDNGSEYSWGDMIDGFTALSKLAGVAIKELGAETLADQRVREARQAVVRSIAYNAKGKPGIEGAFGNLEQVFFSGVAGWTAGDRMRKKTHAKGRDPIPFPGDMAAFMAAISTHLDHYHRRPQYGWLAGKSPNEALRERIEAGWGKTVLADPKVLALAFSTVETRVVDRGCVTFKPRDGRSQRYYCDALLSHPGETITIRVPAYDPKFLFCFDAAGNEIGVAHPEQVYHPLDVAGALEGAARNKILRRQIAGKSKHVALLDLTEETARHIGHLPEAPEVPTAAVIDAGMFDRMAQIEAEERARLAAPQPARRRVSQWGTGANAALAALKFEDEDEDK